MGQASIFLISLPFTKPNITLALSTTPKSQSYPSNIDLSWFPTFKDPGTARSLSFLYFFMSLLSLQIFLVIRSSRRKKKKKPSLSWTLIEHIVSIRHFWKRSKSQHCTLLSCEIFRTFQAHVPIVLLQVIVKTVW